MPDKVEAEYTKKVKEILEKLDAGRDRNSISEDYNYSTWKSLDIYMRRKGFRWNGSENIYEPEVSRLDSIKEELLSTIPLKAERIMDKFDEGLDPRTIADDMGFNSHREIASYMKENSMKWDSELGNYIQVFNLVDKDNRIEEDKDDIIIEDEDIITADVSMYESKDMNKYIPILELLYKSKDKLSSMLLENNTSIIPSYAVPGVAKNKSIYMSDLLGRLLEDFSQTKNVKQKEIVQTALIEYFKKYGYNQEVKLLLEKK